MTASPARRKGLQIIRVLLPDLGLVGLVCARTRPVTDSPYRPQSAGVRVRYHDQFAYVTGELTDGGQLP